MHQSLLTYPRSSEQASYRRFDLIHAISGTMADKFTVLEEKIPPAKYERVGSESKQGEEVKQRVFFSIHSRMRNLSLSLSRAFFFPSMLTTSILKSKQRRIYSFRKTRETADFD